MWKITQNKKNNFELSFATMQQHYWVWFTMNGHVNLMDYR